MYLLRSFCIQELCVKTVYEVVYIYSLCELEDFTCQKCRYRCSGAAIINGGRWVYMIAVCLPACTGIDMVYFHVIYTRCVYLTFIICPV